MNWTPVQGRELAILFIMDFAEHLYRPRELLGYISECPEPQVDDARLRRRGIRASIARLKLNGNILRITLWA